MSAVDDRIEPLSLPDGIGTMTVSDSAAITSIAISLKRIADAMCGTEGTSGVLELLNPLQVRNNY